MVFCKLVGSVSQFALTVLIMFQALPAVAGEFRITFLAQHGVPPLSIEIENGAKFSTTFKFAESQSASINGNDFNDVLDTFFVTVAYEGNRFQSFELNLLRPSAQSAIQDKRIFLSQPERFLGGNYSTAVKKSRRLFRSDRRKAFVPFFQCRESYLKAFGLGDKQTAIRALGCWIRANHRMVFADPKATRRLFAPDPQAAEAFNDLTENLKRKDAGWISGLKASELSQRDLEQLANQVLEMKLSNWLYYKLIRLRVVGASTGDVCKWLEKFDEAYTRLTQTETELLSTERFNIDFGANQRIRC